VGKCPHYSGRQGPVNDFAGNNGEIAISGKTLTRPAVRLYWGRFLPYASRICLLAIVGEVIAHETRQIWFPQERRLTSPRALGWAMSDAFFVGLDRPNASPV